MNKETIRTVISVSKQWWLKINTKPVRTSPLDGAEFSHIIKMQYQADGKYYTIRKWINSGLFAPTQGNTVKVIYSENKPSKGKVVL